KGRTQSVPIAAIYEKMKTLVQEQGVKRIVLTSEDTGSYGKDIGSSIVELLRRLHEIPGDFSLHIHFFDPRWLRAHGEELGEIFALGKVRYIQLPLQSAANTVLGKMRRVYRIEQVLPTIERYRQTIPSLAMATQIIAGFPGETEEEHQLTR